MYSANILSINLQRSLWEFTEVFKRSADNFGEIELAPAPLPITEPFPLGPALSEYFATLKMAERPRMGGQLNVRLYRIDELVTAQQSWRWITDPKTGTREDPNWPAEWVVFADSEGNAVFIDRTNGSVHGSIQKVNRKLADDLPSFIAALSAAMKVEMDGFNYEILDDDFNVLESFLDELNKAVAAQIGSTNAENFVDLSFG